MKCDFEPHTAWDQDAVTRDLEENGDYAQGLTEGVPFWLYLCFAGGVYLLGMGIAYLFDFARHAL
jgi:hypothetical protein